MGSDSDWPVMRAAAEALEEFGVPYEADVVSAHRMPRDMIEYGSSAAGRGLRVIIAGAGGAAHLPGMLASVTPLPVIGVPVPLANLGGLDSLLSIVQMPAGIPVATVAVGGARNAGLLAVRILAAAGDQAAEALRARLVSFAEQLAGQARAKGAALRDHRTDPPRLDPVDAGMLPRQPLDEGIGPAAWEADVSIGATLAAARRRAGLTVSDVSDRTRVRENIIRGIEQDDYAACGGDFYARGHIRAIARAVGEDPQPLVEEYDASWRSGKDISAAEAFEPVMPIRTRERRRVRWTAVLALAVLAVLGFASYKFVSGAGGHARPAAAVSQHPARRGGQASAPPASTPVIQASTALATPAVTPSVSPASVALTPASVAAFGPAGTADGDNSGQAGLAIAGNPARPWHSDWYTTPDFGNLQAGTGLLLDMGHPVTVTSVRLWLGGGSGANLQLRAGSGPGLASLPRVAGVSGAGSQVQLRLSTPVEARYLLIWFTKLPPDSAGTYQASVYRITVQGRP
jgi:5-(carboxyamino)imidazole ribonucleotide mutase